MTGINILAIAIALAMDAFAVSIATGVSLKNVSLRQTFRLSWHFAPFQALMPVIGWGAGQRVHAIVDAYAHWLAFGLLTIIGVNMIREALKGDAGEKQKRDPTKGASLVMLSVATSIDALAQRHPTAFRRLSDYALINTENREAVKGMKPPYAAHY